jgi:F-type H+-transporting ATPase subunit gamma
MKSIRSTRKIMKAMELVAASKMRKTTSRAVGLRPYADELRGLLAMVRRHVPASAYSFLVGHPTAPAKSLLVVVASDRGLCGSFNQQVLRKAIEVVQGDGELELLAIGRRAELAARRTGKLMVASFEGISNEPAFARIHPMVAFLAEAFLRQTYGRIEVVYTEYRSSLSLVPSVKRLLPFGLEPMEVEVSLQEQKLFLEPDPDALVRQLLPRILEIELYQALLESAASEHSARMLAMKNAGDAAGDMLDALTVTLNRTRQASITREIAEISAGKAAIE